MYGCSRNTIVDTVQYGYLTVKNHIFNIWFLTKALTFEHLKQKYDYTYLFDNNSEDIYLLHISHTFTTKYDEKFAHPY